MRRKNRPIRENRDASIDMTPMLDIVFILLIFFIVTTSFVKSQGFLVKKAEATKSVNNSSTSISVHIDENGLLFFNNTLIDIERLPARIEYHIANNPTEVILVRPHKETNYQKVVDVLDQIKAYKDLKISIGTYTP